MLISVRERFVKVLIWSEKYTKTDMRYLMSGGFWLLIGQISAVIFSLALAVLFGHFASQDTYGNYKYIINIGSLLASLSLSGLGTAVTRAAAHGEEGSLRQGFYLSIRWSVIMVLVGICASIYYYFIGNTFVAAALAVTAVVLPVINSLSLYDSFLTGLREFRLDTIFSILSLAFTTIALGITLLFFSQRAIVLVGVYFTANLITDAIWYLLSLQRASNNATDPEMLKYGFHLSIMGILGAIADKIDSISIFTFLGPAQFAVYSYSIAIPEQIKGLIKTIAPLSMPKFAQRTMAEIKQAIWGKMALLFMAIAGVTLIYILFAPALFTYLFPVYISSMGYSQLYALSILFSFVTPVTSVLQAHKKTKALYVLSNVPAVILLFTLPLLTLAYGIGGAIVAQIMYRAAIALVAIGLITSVKE